MKNWVAFLLIVIGTGCGKKPEPNSAPLIESSATYLVEFDCTVGPDQKQVPLGMNGKNGQPLYGYACKDVTPKYVKAGAQ